MPALSRPATHEPGLQIGSANKACTPDESLPMSRCGPQGALRLLLKAFSSDVRAPSSSMDTHKFIANGFDVRERISAITSLIAAGDKPCAPKDPSPPKLETAAVNLWDDNPPSGP